MVPYLCAFVLFVLFIWLAGPPPEGGGPRAGILAPSQRIPRPGIVTITGRTNAWRHERYYILKEKVGQTQSINSGTKRTRDTPEATASLGPLPASLPVGSRGAADVALGFLSGMVALYALSDDLALTPLAQYGPDAPTLHVTPTNQRN